MGLISIANRAAEAPAATDAHTSTRPKESGNEGALESVATTSQVGRSIPQQSGQKPAPPTGVLERLVEFIPTETITLYWVALPAAAAVREYYGSGSFADRWVNLLMYSGLLALTPLFLLLAFLSAKAAAEPTWPPLRDWPWWKAVAATVSFAVWGFAVPSNPFISDSLLQMGTWVIALLASTLISLIDPIVETWIFPRRK